VEKSITKGEKFFAVIRLPGAEIKPSPKLNYVVTESVNLAKLILWELTGQ